MCFWQWVVLSGVPATQTCHEDIIVSLAQVGFVALASLTSIAHAWCLACAEIWHSPLQQQWSVVYEDSVAQCMASIAVASLEDHRAAACAFIIL